MAGYTCPFCSQMIAISLSTHSVRYPCFSSSDYRSVSPSPHDAINVHFYHCPNCDKTSIIIEGYGHDVKDIFTYVYPNSSAKKFPEYIPLQLRQDYEEAFAIVNLSPKASATLSRRCMQGMIRDYWGITKNNLSAAIDELKTKVQPPLWAAIDGTRKIGNIGAHMEKDINLIVDIDPDEAAMLLQLIELLFTSWYIRRHEEEQLLEKITKSAQEKEEQRHPN